MIINTNKKAFLKSLATAFLFAGTSIGVSHLVQSTRAGGIFGLAALIPVFIAMLIKYPAFYLGPLYANLTGESLVDGYRREGRWTMILVLIVYLVTIFSVIAAVSLLTSAFTLSLADFAVSPVYFSISLIFFISVISNYGGISLLKKIIQPVIFVMGGAAVFLTFLSFKKLNFHEEFYSLDALFDFSNFPFLLSLVGWMPAGLDLPLLHSVWLNDENNSYRHFKSDFNMGYAITLVFAFTFVFVGSSAIFQTGITLPSSPTNFSISLTRVFTNLVGANYSLIFEVGIVAILLSTLLTLVDGFPRVLSQVTGSISAKRDSDFLLFSYIVQFVGASIIIFFFRSSLKFMVDIVTLFAFLTAPVFATLNHLCIRRVEKNKGRVISSFMTNYSLVGIIFLTLFSLIFLISKAFF